MTELSGPALTATGLHRINIYMSCCATAHETIEYAPELQAERGLHVPHCTMYNGVDESSGGVCHDRVLAVEAEHDRVAAHLRQAGWVLPCFEAKVVRLSDDELGEACAEGGQERGEMLIRRLRDGRPQSICCTQVTADLKYAPR